MRTIYEERPASRPPSYRNDAHANWRRRDGGASEADGLKVVAGRKRRPDARRVDALTSTRSPEHDVFRAVFRMRIMPRLGHTRAEEEVGVAPLNPAETRMTIGRGQANQYEEASAATSGTASGDLRMNRCGFAPVRLQMIIANPRRVDDEGGPYADAGDLSRRDACNTDSRRPGSRRRHHHQFFVSTCAGPGRIDQPPVRQRDDPARQLLGRGSDSSLPPTGRNGMSGDPMRQTVAVVFRRRPTVNSQIVAALARGRSCRRTWSPACPLPRTGHPRQNCS